MAAPSLSTRQAALLLGASQATVKRRVQTGTLAAIGKARGWRFFPTEILRHLRALDSTGAVAFATALRDLRMHECVAQLLELRIAGSSLEKLFDEVVLPAVDGARAFEIVDRVQPLGEPWDRRVSPKAQTAVLLDDGGARARMAGCLLRARAFSVLVPAPDVGAEELLAIVERSNTSLLWMDGTDIRLGMAGELQQALGRTNAVLVVHGIGVVRASSVIAVASMRDLVRVLDGRRPALNASASEASRGCLDVLVVDDDEDLRDSVTEFLSGLGYAVASAPDGAEALRLLLGGIRPKVILLDKSTPVLDGPRFLEAAGNTLEGVAVVSMSGTDEEMMHSSVVATLRKPFDLDELQKVVQAHVPRSNSTKD